MKILDRVRTAVVQWSVAIVRGVLRWFGSVARAITPILISDLTWLLLLSVSGTSVMVVGVYILAGSGYACIAAGVLLMLGGSIIYRGMNDG
jgi:hypothetical protein